jgi:hypothetical protein
MAVKISRNNISEHLLEYQLRLIDKTVKDAVLQEDWRTAWHYPPEYAEKFKSYAIPLIKKTFKCNKSKAEATLNFFLVNFGLKIQI